jgi:hypothetical protein
MKPLLIENNVRTKLGEMFGTEFTKGKLITGHDSKGKPKFHEFDLVSENTDIVGEVKSGRCTRRNYDLALVDCLYLSRIKAQIKLMVFTNKELYQYFTHNSEGIISKEIRPILVLPNDELKLIKAENQAYV